MVLSICCGLSILLCFLFSSSLLDFVTINLGLLPLFVGILYSKYRNGVLLVVFYIVLYLLFTDDVNLPSFLLDTGVLVYPLLFLSVTHFNRKCLLIKLQKISIYVFIGASLLLVSPIVESRAGWTIFTRADSVFYLVAYVVTGCFMIYLIEMTLERIELREQIRRISDSYIVEVEKMRQITDRIPFCITSIDRFGRIQSVNFPLLQFIRDKGKLQALVKEQLIGQELIRVLQMVLTSIPTGIEKALEGTDTANELVYDGSHTYLISSYPLKSYSDEVTGAVVIGQDITELELLRSELGHAERLSLVGQMAASITHEIRNPMAVVRGFMQLMREKSPSSLDHYYKIVLEELDRANGIISDFLSLAQNRIVEKEECHLHDIIHDLSPLLWADANLRGQSIELKLSEHVPDMQLNSKEIKQLLLNLSRNAMEAMEDRGVLTIETIAAADNVELRVSDTGPGIPKPVQDKLFEPFYTTKAKGTGLGLALCISIAERHNGTIVVDSEEGRGTTFAVVFKNAPHG
ncbi:ATP-binding protein [Paenibacillus sediminis]|uniref:histidine kinase n=1 Tax=Paenibacillus sediminis TaxID=664909 RepID=A0ABS4H672_9BACL|nr:ATP-binding protein [Paenibacillus sediminis]MBP1938030.1 signal transduction histidine kinase [Paenibacillus sediminis]